ncbi:MAG: hypothetical protein J6F30_04610 [Cellulosilyticum sp.]|nr:hypothetical protein [Cellulosilyticum sp.]
MNAKEYLSEIKYRNKALKEKMEKLEYLKAKALKTTVSLDNDGGNGIHKKDTMEDTIIDYLIFEQEIEREMDSLGEFKLQVSEEIDKLDKTEEAMVLFYRYVELLDWKQIAREVGCSIRTCHEINNRGLENFKQTVSLHI